MLVEGWLSRAASARPDATALETPRGSWSYAQLHGAASAGAAQLAGAGAGRGSRVAIALPAGLELAQAIHACLLLGAVAVPVDLRLSQTERDAICAGAQVLIDEPLDSARATDGAPVPSRHELDATAVVIHTSGTTAQPRPIELTYGNFLWSALGSAVALGLDPNERWLCALPLSHVGGLSILLRSAIYATTAVVHERFEEDRVLNALNAEGVTLVSLVATTLTRLLDAGLERPPALRSALTGGGPVPAALVQRAHAAGVPVSLTYGLTESCSQATTTPVAASSPEGEVGEAPTTAGPPLFCTRVRIARDDADADGLTEHAAAPGDATGDRGRSSSPARPWRPARSRRTVGCTPATSASSTSGDGCALPGACRTRSSAAVRTSRRQRWRRCSRPTLRFWRRRCSGAPIRSGARRSRRSSWRARALSWTSRSCAPTARWRLRPTRCPSGSR